MKNTSHALIKAVFDVLFKKLYRVGVILNTEIDNAIVKGEREMTNLKKLNKIIENRGLKKNHLAEQIGIMPSTLTFRLNGQSDFKVSEAAKLGEVLGLSPSEKIAIFFN